MKLVIGLTIFSGLIAQVFSACDNACSGHGTCTFKDICACWSDWRTGDEMGGDCSDRSCPFELAWVDTPDHSGLRHKYVECAGRGICDRTSGECQCFDGYTGKGCQRTTCPNDCSGHGRCEYLADMPYGTVWGDYYGAFESNVFGYSVDGDSSTGTAGIGDKAVTLSADQYWDAYKTRGCVCDAMWTDVDCSRRMCPKGNDVLGDSDCNHKRQVQTILMETAEWWNATTKIENVTDFVHHTFAIKFTSTLNETFTTYPIKLPAVYQIRSTLDDEIKEALLKLPNRVIDDVDVTVSFPPSGWDEWNTTMNGPTWDLRGSGFFNRNVSISITFTGDAVAGKQNLVSLIDYSCEDGCTPKIDGLPLNAWYVSSYVKETQASAYTNYECGRRGKCDYDSGLCQCFDGYTGEACGIQTALI